MKFDNLHDEYQNLLDTCEVRSDWKDAIDRRARAILSHKDRYKAVGDELGMPWEVIGVIHSLECGLRFDQHLHNGDPLDKKTYRVPRGRGPFDTWEESAKDALKMKGWDKIEDWSDARVAYELERYNGFGYRLRRTGVLSPYLWSGTTHYTVGKFVSDGKYVKTAKSAQSGAIPLIKRIKEIDITKKEIVKQSSKLSLVKRFKAWLAGLSLSTVAADALGFLEQVKDYIVANPTTMVYAVAGLTTLGFIVFKLVEDKGVKEYQEGRYIPSGQVDQ